MSFLSQGVLRLFYHCILLNKGAVIIYRGGAVKKGKGGFGASKLMGGGDKNTVHSF